MSVRRFCFRIEEDQHFSGTFNGSLEPFSDRVWRLGSPRFVWGGREEPFEGDVEVSSELVGTGPVFGREVSLSGPFRCAVPFRNPGRVEDGTLDLHRPPGSGVGEGIPASSFAGVRDVFEPGAFPVSFVVGFGLW